jgi:hypothetical protein
MSENDCNLLVYTISILFDDVLWKIIEKCRVCESKKKYCVHWVGHDYWNLSSLMLTCKNIYDIVKNWIENNKKVITFYIDNPLHTIKDLNIVKYHNRFSFYYFSYSLDLEFATSKKRKSISEDPMICSITLHHHQTLTCYCFSENWKRLLTKAKINGYNIIGLKKEDMYVKEKVANKISNIIKRHKELCSDIILKTDDIYVFNAFSK